MSYKDLREWLKEAEKMRETKGLRGADWNLEIGTITRLAAQVGASPALV